MQIEKLREVIRKLQAGEEVDVEKALGTGVPEEEQAWEDALREIEEEERLWTEAQQRKRDELERQHQKAAKEEQLQQDASPISEINDLAKTDLNNRPSQTTPPPFRPPGFY